MRYCPMCKVKVNSAHAVCPLCQGALDGDLVLADASFPPIMLSSKKYSLIIRIMMFISAVLVLLCFAGNYLFPAPGFWSLYIAIAVVYFWLIIKVGIRKQNNIPKNIVWQAVVLLIFMLVIDYLSGWHKWSVEYAVPIMLTIVIITLWGLVTIMKLPEEKYIVYLITQLLICAVPLLFLLFTDLPVVFPTVICLLSSLISLSALIFFKGETLKREFKKRLHL